MVSLNAEQMTMHGQGYTQVNDIAAYMVANGMATQEQVNRMTGPKAQSHTITGNERVVQGRELQGFLVKEGIATKKQVSQWNNHLQNHPVRDNAHNRSATRAAFHPETIAASKGVTEAGLQTSAQVKAAISDLKKGLDGNGTHASNVEKSRGKDTGRSM